MRVDPRHGPRAQGIRGRSACADGWPRASTGGSLTQQARFLRLRNGGTFAQRNTMGTR